jgi:hypothetical protein
MRTLSYRQLSNKGMRAFLSATFIPAGIILPPDPTNKKTDLPWDRPLG